MEFSEKKRLQLESKVLSYRFRDKNLEDRKTYDDVFDHSTLLTLYDLMSNGHFDILDFPLATGKEGNVFRADTKDGKHLAVKIYRVSNSTFKNIQKYIQGDMRFKNVGKNHRRGIYLWAQKEFRNLERMREAGVPVPEPIVCQKNVVVMEYIGTDEQPARHLKDVELANPKKTFDFLIDRMRAMHRDAGLVHADLSEYNILMKDEEPVIIDVGQAVLKNHPMAGEFLERDIANLAKFFNRKGVIYDTGELKARIVGEAGDEKNADGQSAGPGPQSGKGAPSKE